MTGRSTALAALAAVAWALAAGAVAPPRAIASGAQVAIAEDDPQVLSDPARTLPRLRMLGVDVVRISLHWASFAPRPHSFRRPRFRATDPAQYPRGVWARYDRAISDAQSLGIQVNLQLAGGVPLWATGAHPPPGGAHDSWNPRPPDYWAFVRAVGTRYSGSFVPSGSTMPLPRVSFWSVWNEPDLGYALAPQGVPGHLTIENSARMYRNLLGAAWSALHQTGHGSDTILIGDLAPRGVDVFGMFASMKPLVFLRALYCVDGNFRELRGNAAAQRGCPATAAGSARFAASNPALFQATGFAQHLWMRWYPPNVEAHPDPDFASFPYLDRLATTLDRLQRRYGSPAQLPIYDTEFGYITDPPNNSSSYVSPDTAARYLNWAEYLSWRDPRVMSFDQYLLRDLRHRGPRYSGWASGLLGPDRGVPKATYYAWRLPLYLPRRPTGRGRSVEVWGCVRPAKYALGDTGSPQRAELQFRRLGGHHYEPLRALTITDPASCYFDVHVAFPGPGTLRLTYTYPGVDPWLPSGLTAYSRQIPIRVH